jgi:hypothetical protein
MKEMSTSTIPMLGLRIARGKTMGIRNHGEAAGAENNE